MVFRVVEGLPFSPKRRLVLAGGAALAAGALAGPAFAATSGKFVNSLWPEASARGVSRRMFDTALGDFSPLQSVINLSKKQPEFVSTVADYVSKRATNAQAGTGQGKAAEWAQTLAGIETRWGVQSEVVLGIWGIETNYGGYMGGTNTVHALATLAWEGRRADYFRNELLTSLQILDAGHVTPRNMVGSWAGAMGHPQFMPSSFMAYAVDYKGDGHKDLWGSVPDGLASIANYLKAHGWRSGETWGYEIRPPRGFDYRQVWAGSSMSVRDWAAQGVARASGRPFPRQDDIARIYMPMGGNGPMFLVLANFDVIKKYNKSDSYALAVGHLADRILGTGGFVQPWPNDTALGSAARQEVQTLLLRKGYAIGSADGAIGPKTRAAVIDWQARAGLLPDGHVGGRLLAALRS